MFGVYITLQIPVKETKDGSQNIFFCQGSVQTTKRRQFFQPNYSLSAMQIRQVQIHRIGWAYIGKRK